MSDQANTEDRAQSESSCIGKRREKLAPFRGRLLFICLAVALIMIGLVFPFRLHGRSWSLLFDCAHGPVFCSLVLFVAGCLDPSSVGLPDRYAVLLGASRGIVLLLSGTCLLLGLLGEFLQGFAGRSPSVGDLLANTAGIAAGTLWIQTGRKRIAFFRTAAGLVLLASVTPPILGMVDAASQKAEFPLLASFERWMETSIWETRNASIRRSADWASHGTYSLDVRLNSGRYSAVELRWPIPDWTGFGELLIDFYNPAPVPLPLRIKLADYQHQITGYKADQRYESEFELPGKSRFALRIPLEDVLHAPRGRLMHLDQMAMLQFYVQNLADSQSVFIDNLRLQARESDSESAPAPPISDQN